MVNSISITGLSRSRTAVDAEPGKLQSPASPASSKAPDTEQVVLSTAANSLPQALREGPPIDRALVDKIGAAIASGNYPLNADAIATAMLRDINDFSGL